MGCRQSHVCCSMAINKHQQISLEFLAAASCAPGCAVEAHKFTQISLISSDITFFLGFGSSSGRTKGVAGQSRGSHPCDAPLVGRLRPPAMRIQPVLLALLVLFSSCSALKAEPKSVTASHVPKQTKALKATVALVEASSHSSQPNYASRWSKEHKQLADVEDMDYFWGMPVLAWVVVVDVIACILYFVGMRTVSSLARKKAEDTDYLLQSPV